MTLENRTDRKSICKERYKKQDPYDRWLWNALKRAKLHIKKRQVVSYVFLVQLHDVSCFRCFAGLLFSSVIFLGFGWFGF